MKFDNPKYVERYEDVIFEPQTALNTVVVNGQHQAMKDFRFIADNTDEVTVFNWNRARLSVDFKVNKTGGGPIAIDDHNGIVNGSHSPIRNLSVTINGKKLYDCNQANHCVNIKNMLEYSPAYAESLGTNEFFYVDTSRHAQEDKTNANYNKGFAAHKARLGISPLSLLRFLLIDIRFSNGLKMSFCRTRGLSLTLKLKKMAMLFGRQVLIVGLLLRECSLSYLELLLIQKDKSYT